MIFFVLFAGNSYRRAASDSEDYSCRIFPFSPYAWGEVRVGSIADLISCPCDLPLCEVWKS